MPNRIVDVVDALNAGVASGEDFFVTVMDDGGGTGTFARDNWESLPQFCYSRDRLAFVIRRFEADRCPLDRRLPMKTVCGMFATSEHLQLFCAEAMEKAMNTDAETGARLPKQPDIRFVDARDVFPILDLGTRREARPVETDH
jgi:hypothetical protein